MKKILSIVSAALISTPLLAASPNWNYLSGGYASVDVEDAGDYEPTGYTINGSALVGENVLLYADYLSASDDLVVLERTDFNNEVSVDTDIDWARVGIGYRMSASDSTDFYGRVSFEQIEVSASAFGSSESEDENGFGLTVGVRSMLTDKFEVDANIGYVDIGDAGDDVALSASAYYHLSEQFSAGLSYVIFDDLDILSVSARYSF